MNYRSMSGSAPKSRLLRSGQIGRKENTSWVWSRTESGSRWGRFSPATEKGANASTSRLASTRHFGCRGISTEAPIGRGRSDLSALTLEVATWTLVRPRHRDWPDGPGFPQKDGANCWQGMGFLPRKYQIRWGVVSVSR
jgi:hypothetical protein